MKHKVSSLAAELLKSATILINFGTDDFLRLSSIH